MLSILVTESARNEVGKHHLFNNVFYKLKKHKIRFKILTFKLDEKKKIFSFRGLKPEVITTKVSFSQFINNIFLLYNLIKLNPDHLIIGGYGFIQNWVSLIYALTFRKKITIWTGASETSSLNKGFFYFYIKSFFIKKFDNAIVYGTRSKIYLKKLGFKNKIILTKNISDIEFFGKKNFIKSHKNKKPSFIYCGRLVKHKGIEYLLKTFERFDKNKYQLTIVGDGPLRSFVKSKISSRKVNAYFLGQLEQDDLACELKKNNYFISPSLNDPFSRILSEAIVSGCFCISSIYDDASFDLINSSNGIIFDPKKDNALFNVLSNIFNNQSVFEFNKKSYKQLNYDTNKYSTEYTLAIVEALNVY